MKILLVHNEIMLASMYKTKLESGGYEVEIIDPKDYTPNQLLEFIKKGNKNMDDETTNTTNPEVEVVVEPNPATEEQPATESETNPQAEIPSL